MIKVKRFVNELMTSICYVIYDEDTKRCLVIDPASEKSLREIQFIEEKGLALDYIILTHEHTDHNWGVNSLKEHFPKSKLVCSELCNKYVKKTNRAYFLFYYDDPNYHYEIAPADVLVKEDGCMDWNGLQIQFVMTPGHSYGSMCFEIKRMLFTGDTIMPFKPYFNGRDSSRDDWEKSIEKIEKLCHQQVIVYPGHGETMSLGNWSKNYKKMK